MHLLYAEAMKLLDDVAADTVPLQQRFTVDCGNTGELATVVTLASTLMPDGGVTRVEPTSGMRVTVIFRQRYRERD